MASSDMEFCVVVNLRLLPLVSSFFHAGVLDGATFLILKLSSAAGTLKFSCSTLASMRSTITSYGGAAIMKDSRDTQASSTKALPTSFSGKSVLS